MQHAIRILTAISLVGAALPVAAQQPQEPTITFRLPKSQADQLERVLGAMPTNQVGALYFAIQNQIFASVNADMQAQRDAFEKQVRDKIAAEAVKPTDSAPKE